LWSVWATRPRRRRRQHPPARRISRNRSRLRSSLNNARIAQNPGFGFERTLGPQHPLRRASAPTIGDGFLRANQGRSSHFLSRPRRGNHKLTAAKRRKGQTVSGEASATLDYQLPAHTQVMKYEVIIYWSNEDAAFIAEV